MTRYAPLADRFWAKVDKRGPDECWPWTGSAGANGYGKLRNQNRHPGSHRVAWELANGAIPPGLFVCHRCDVPLCVNPAHLFLGTHADNVADMVAKGRQRSPRGEMKFGSKLDAASVETMRVMYRAKCGSYADLARWFGVSRGAVGAALAGRSWAHLPHAIEPVRRDYLLERGIIEGPR